MYLLKHQFNYSCNAVRKVYWLVQIIRARTSLQFTFSIFFFVDNISCERSGFCAGVTSRFSSVGNLYPVIVTRARECPRHGMRWCILSERATCACVCIDDPIPRRSDLPSLDSRFPVMNHESDPSCQVCRRIDCRESRRRLELTHSRRITIRRFTLKWCVSSFAYWWQSHAGKYWYRPWCERQVPDKSHGCSSDDCLWRCTIITMYGWFAISLCYEQIPYSELRDIYKYQLLTFCNIYKCFWKYFNNIKFMKLRNYWNKISLKLYRSII